MGTASQIIPTNRSLVNFVGPIFIKLDMKLFCLPPFLSHFNCFVILILLPNATKQKKSTDS